MILPRKTMCAINSLERKYSVNYRVLGVDLWPVFRNTMMMSVTHYGGAVGKRHGAGISFFSFLRSLKSCATLKSVNALVLTSDKFIENINGNVIYRDACVFSEKFRDAGKSMLVLTQNGSKNCSMDEEIHSVYSFTVISYVFAKLFSFLDRYSSIYHYVNVNHKRACEIFIHENDKIADIVKKEVLLRNIYFVIFATLLFKFIIRRSSPEECYVVCYYSLIGMAFCSACNQLNVKISDIQHGVSGKYMRAYGRWVDVPESGYSTLPSRFLCWTSFDKEAIDEWTTNCSSSHNASVSGNFWRDFFFKNHFDFFYKLECTKLKNIISSFDKTILLTFQSDVIKEEFKYILESAPLNYCFFVRLHPDFKNSDISSVEYLCKKFNKNTFLVMPTILPIQLVMRFVDIHITEWSASVYDAYFEGVKSIVISETGCDYFDVFIKQGFVSCCSTVDKVWGAIDAL